jgi:hypothetical protein
VVRKLTPEVLPSSGFGGPRTTKVMIHVTWHLTTIAFLTVGSALLLSRLGSPRRYRAGDRAGGRRRIHRLRCDRGGADDSLHAIPRSLVRHPGPALLTRHRGAGMVGSSLNGELAGPGHGMSSSLQFPKAHQVPQHPGLALTVRSRREVIDPRRIEVEHLRARQLRLRSIRVRQIVIMAAWDELPHPRL